MAWCLPWIEAKLNILFWPHTGPSTFHWSEGPNKLDLFVLPNGAHRTDHRIDRLLLALSYFLAYLQWSWEVYLRQL